MRLTPPGPALGGFGGGLNSFLQMVTLSVGFGSAVDEALAALVSAWVGAFARSTRDTIGALRKVLPEDHVRR